MPGTYQAIYGMKGVEPLCPEKPRSKALSFIPGQTILKGTLLGQISAASANEVQTINYANTWAEGDTLTLSVAGIDGGTFSTTLTMNATPAFTNAAVKTAIEALFAAAGYDGVTVTITGGPGATDQIVTFGGTAAAFNMPLMVATYETAGNGTVAVDATTGGQRLSLWGPYVGTKLADPTTGPTAASAATGSLPLLGQFVVTYTHLTAQGESLPSPGTPVALTTTDQSINVTPAALPAGTTGIRIYLNGVFAEESTQTTATLVNVGAIAGTASIAMPTANTAFTNTDGRHIAKAILQYDIRTDNFGRVVFGGATTMPQNGAYELTAPAWFGGEFLTTDLVGLTADAINDLKGRLQSGSISDGILAF